MKGATHISSNHTIVNVDGSLTETQLAKSEASTSWQGRNIKKICYGAAIVEGFFSVSLFVSGSILNNQWFMLAGAGSGMLSLSTLIVTFYAGNSKQIGPDIPIDG
jgi:hypothetical protein